MSTSSIYGISQLTSDPIKALLDVVPHWMQLNCLWWNFQILDPAPHVKSCWFPGCIEDLISYRYHFQCLKLLAPWIVSFLSFPSRNLIKLFSKDKEFTKFNLLMSFSANLTRFHNSFHSFCYNQSNKGNLAMIEFLQSCKLAN